MSAYVYISSKLRGGADNRIYFECPGCEGVHGIAIGDGAGPRWGFNGNVDQPTFTPSIKVTCDWGDPPKHMVCHSFVTDGKIQFLADCTHELAGQTVDLPDWDTYDFAPEV